MNPEKGERKVHGEVDGEWCLADPSNYAANDDDDPGLAYLEGGLIFPRYKKPPGYSEGAVLDEMSQQPQHLKPTSFDSCNINLVNLLSMPSCSAVSSPSNNIPLFLNNSAAGFEPLQLHLNLTPQQLPPLGGAYSYGDEYGYSPNGGKEPLSRQPKNFVTERQRRQTFNDKFQHLRSLLPNPNKNDRASIVGDAIDYIKELIRTVKELNLLVEKKRCLRQRIKRHKPTTTAEDNGTCITEIKSEQVDQSLRSSWLQRNCKDTDIDVRIVDDEVTIKLVQRKKIINLLVYVSRTLDELRLQLQHVTGGHVGDYYSFLFNTKISQGSSVYAGAIANKLIEVVDRQYAALQ